MASNPLDKRAIAPELVTARPAFDGIATKFFEHSIAIANSLLRRVLIPPVRIGG